MLDWHTGGATGGDIGLQLLPSSMLSLVMEDKPAIGGCKGGKWLQARLPCANVVLWMGIRKSDYRYMQFTFSTVLHVHYQ